MRERFWALSESSDEKEVDHGAMVLHNAIGLLRSIVPTDGRDKLQADLERIESFAEISHVRRDDEGSISIYFKRSG
jgi:hypothetical protein